MSSFSSSDAINVQSTVTSAPSKMLGSNDLSRDTDLTKSSSGTAKQQQFSESASNESQRARSNIERKMSKRIFGPIQANSKLDNDEVDSIGYQPSASEDDEMRQSDSGASSKRQSWTNRSAPSSILLEGVSPSPNSMSPLPQTNAGSGQGQSNSASFPASVKNRNIRSIQSTLSPTASVSSGSGLLPNLSTHSHSGGEASASSSRSHLPLQSKTSLYRRQASAASSVNNETFDDTIPLGHGTNRGSESLSRAKSISSVSSVNSTSSMEAVPFRAAPLGNVRMGFGGLAKGGLRGKDLMRSDLNKSMPYATPAQAVSNAPRPSVSHEQLRSIQTDETQLSDTNLSGSNAAIISPTKQRILPKDPSNEWQYRNAPGMGMNRNMRPLPHTVSGSSRLSQPRAGIPSSFAALTMSDGIESDESSLNSVQRPKPSIRSKLAKRAGKLGLKPLTSVNTSVIRSNSPPPAIILDPATSPSPDESQMTGDIPSMTMMGPAPLTPTARTSPEVSLRNSKSYFGPVANTTVLSNLITGNGLLEGELNRVTTSSITNAPLIVPKHPPGPPGTGPPPSPGLVGSPSNYMNSFTVIHSTRISPVEQEVESLEQVKHGEQMQDLGLSTPDNVRPMLNRPGSVSSGISGILSNILGGGNAGGGNSNRSSFGPIIGANGGRPPSRGSSGSPAPMNLTPAQKIQMEARAGLATVPSEPSGASPGPEMEEDDPSNLSNAAMRRKTMSTIMSTNTARPKDRLAVTQKWTGTNLANDGDGQSNSIGISGITAIMRGSSSPKMQPRRPGFLRALTSESLGRRSLTPSIKGEEVRSSEGSKLTTKEQEGSPSGLNSRNRGGSASPRSRSSGSDKYVLSIQNSPSFLRLEVPTDRVPPEDLQEGKSRQLVSSIAPFSENSSSAKGLLVANEGQKEGRVTEENETNLSLKNEEEDGRLQPNRVNSETTPSNLPYLAVSSTSSPTRVESKFAEMPTRMPSEANKNIPSQLAPQPNNESEAANTRARGISNASRIARTRDDFYFGDLIGEGSYSTVMEAWDLLPLREKGISVPNQAKSDSNNALAAIAGKTSKKKRAMVNLDGGKVYAIKILDKVHILKERKQKYVSVEKEALSLLTRHPGVITLYWTFQDRDSLYFVLEMAPNGELLSWIKKLGSFNETCAKYYASQLLDTIQAIHEVGVLHRDVKPENILLDSQMRIRLADFGSAKIIGRPSEEMSDANKKHKQRPSSFVGTAEYVSPELLNDKQVSEASDFWAVGCILFQMLCGRPPFKGASEYQTFQKIMHCAFEFQDGFSVSSKDLITRLLRLVPDERPSFEEMKKHAFFEGIDWDSIWTSEAPTLAAGLYKRAIIQQSTGSGQEATSLESSMESQDDGIASASDGEPMRGGKSEDTNAQGHESIRSEGGDNSIEDRMGTADDDDADDDDSSLSDAQEQQSQQQAMFRRRGFSAGASAAERMMAQVSNTTRKGGNLFSKVAAGLSSNERHDISNNSSRPQRSSVLSGRPALSARSSSQFSGNEITSAYPPDRQSIEAAQFNVSLATSWAALLLPHESLLYACPVFHKTTGALLRTSNKKRQLLLTDFPRLLCVKETNDQLKVKSEVILGMPLAMMPRAGTPTSFKNRERSSSTQRNYGQAEDSNESQDDEPNLIRERERILAIRTSQMRRQSSAGPLLPSSPTSTSGMSTDRNEGMERYNSTRMRRGSTLTGKGEIGFPTAATSTGNLSNLRLSMPVKSANPTHSSPLTPTPSRASYPVFGGINTNQTSANEVNLKSGRYTASFGSIVDVTQASPNVMTSIEAKSIRSFVVHTPARSYLYEDPSGDSSHWIKSITLAARRHGQIGSASNLAGTSIPFTTHSTIPT